MKKISLLLLLAVNALAGNGHIYLGVLPDVQQCANYAGSLGFQLGVWGAGFDNTGAYYPFFNSCFGSSYKVGPFIPGVPVGPVGPVPQGETQAGPPKQITRAAAPQFKKYVELPESAEADSVAAVLMNGMAQYFNSGAMQPVTRDQIGTGYVMNNENLLIHCFSTPQNGTSLPAQTQGCDISMKRGVGNTVRMPETADTNTVEAVLMKGMQKHLESGINGRPVESDVNNPGYYVMKVGRLLIECYSTPMTGTSLPVQTQGCNVTIR